MDQFKILYRDSKSKARAGILSTPHGSIETPVFMPVGTQGTIKTLTSDEVNDLGFRIILGNTYHLFLRPGLETIKKAGGLQKFMSWRHSILTDSGGYQVFSLATRCKMTEKGVEFSSYVDGTKCELSPETTTSFQLDIGSDVAMCLDVCPPFPSLKCDAKDSMERTWRWAKRCKETYQDWLVEKFPDKEQPRPLLFGITQGASFPDLRRDSAKQTAQIDFPGYSIGGLGLGEPRKLTWELLEASLEPLPLSAPHYLMGFGTPEDIWEGVERGVDMFDCVLPTRNGRSGQAFVSAGRINISNADFKEDFSTLDPSCECACCRNYSRSYLCHLFRAGELLAPRLLTLHNLHFMISLLRKIRLSIIQGSFLQEKKKYLDGLCEKEKIYS